MQTGWGWAALALTALLSTANGQTIYRVDADAPAGGDGSSWAAAFQDLDSALQIAAAGSRVWVAEGIYRPSLPSDPSDPRTSAFRPAGGVRMFGGFEGTELALADRAGLFRTTILDGDLGVPGDRSDNAYNVVRLEGNGARHWVDGFTIVRGNADQTGLARGGGAIAMQLGEKWIRNCNLFANDGRAGGALLSQQSILHVERCEARWNHATELGGALWVTSTATVTDTVFADNRSDARGGAVYANQGSLDVEGNATTRFQNCLFVGNAANNGGGIFVGDPSSVVSAGKVIVSGCTFHANTALMEGGGISTNINFSPRIVVQLYNSILWGNRSGAGTTLGGVADHYTDVRYSLVQGGWVGAGNRNEDPLFRSMALRDLRLQPGSPAIDAGDNDLVLRDVNDVDSDGDELERVQLDLAGRRRRVDVPQSPDTGLGTGPITDMGALESGF